MRDSAFSDQGLLTGEHLLNLVKSIWAEELRQRQQEHLTKIRTINTLCAAKGIGLSGAHTAMAFDASVAESRVRSRLARNTLRKAVLQTQTRWTAAELRSMYLDLIIDINRDIDSVMESVIRVIPVSSEQFNAQMRALAIEEVAAIDKEIAELALFASTPALVDQPPDRGIVVQGHVYGAVQSGASATAYVTVNVDSTSAASLRDAVRALRQSLQDNPPPDLPRSADAVFADLEAETSKNDPESKKIAGFLRSGAAIVETLANAPGAWETVRHAALSMGIPLP